MPFPSRPPFPPAARWLLTSGWLLAGCSSPGSTTLSAGAAADTATPTHSAFSYGAPADSLNGIPGHTFGEPLRNFPGLVEKHDETGVRWYQVPAGQERGWFGKHAEQSINLYPFQDGHFLMFYALATGLEGNPTAMLSLFGPGKEQRDLVEREDWEGKRVGVIYSENRMPPRTCWLEVHSKRLLAVQQARQRPQSQLQAKVAGSKRYPGYPVGHLVPLLIS